MKKNLNKKNLIIFLFCFFVFLILFLKVKIWKGKRLVSGQSGF